MELRITSPTAKQRFPSIEWNYEELKKEVAQYVSDFQNLVITEETEKDGKEYRARLNKLRDNIETVRKEMKEKVNEPFKVFEEQIKSVEKPIDEAIDNLDKQLNELSNLKKERKKEDIKKIWHSMMNVPNYLTLDRIWNEKWLNATYSMKQITKDMMEALSKCRKDVDAIKKLPEYSYEAMEYYMDTLDVTTAIQKASEIAEMAKKKAEAQKSGDASIILPEVPRNEVEKEHEATDPEVKKYTFTFEVTLTAEEAKKLGDYCRSNGIKLTRIK